MTAAVRQEAGSLPRVLVAGIGNVFLGDDGFGVEVVDALRRRALPESIEVADYGIRGFDLASSLLETDVAILVDAVPRAGKSPGDVFVLELALQEPEAPDGPVNGHGLNPIEVFRLARQFGGPLPKTYLVGCCPAPIDETQEGAVGLSPAVQAAVPPACDLVCRLISGLVPTKEA
ncbi:MAG: hydrogenase maturation protease [Candidatus Dormibacteraeota bacterium]|nr:hydrogenase maturation protease [Candidatus Dormibacteraeota bacterium]MBO0744006.1 hydrogenase maturation protease [Candidatus Dormibacteraeota bacterium]